MTNTTPSINTKNLPEEFWTRRGEYTYIRNAAHSRHVSADAVLAAVLARTAATVPSRITPPNIIGGEGSLNYMVALIGPSGTGKTEAANIARELVDFNPETTTTIQPASGEGLISAYLSTESLPDENGKKRKVQKQVWDSVFASVDEGQILDEIGSRKGATILPTIRSLWNGSEVGQALADRDLSRHLTAGSYRFVMLTGFQYETAMTLINDAHGGTPQRFLYMSATDPSIPEPSVSDAAQAERIEPFTFKLEAAAPSAMGVDSQVSYEIRMRRHETQTGKRKADPLDGHRDYLRLRTACLLAILNNGRLNVTTEDWEIAGTIIETSVATRDQIIAAHRANQASREHDTTDRAIRRDKQAEEARSARAIKNGARTAARAIQKHQSETTKCNRLNRCTRTCISQSIAGRHRQLVGIDAIIDEATERGYINETEPGHYTAGETPAPA